MTLVSSEHMIEALIDAIIVDDLSTVKTLLEKGFSTTEAIVIIARKLLRIAFAVWTTGQPFDPAKIGKNACKKP